MQLRAAIPRSRVVGCEPAVAQHVVDEARHGLEAAVVLVRHMREQSDFHDLVEALIDPRHAGDQGVVDDVPDLAVQVDPRIGAVAFDERRDERIRTQQVADAPAALIVDQDICHRGARSGSMARIACSVRLRIWAGT